MISLSKMQLRSDSIVWDVGAGSGSISIEAALIARKGKIFAVEKNAPDVRLILKNVRKFKVPNVEVIHGMAPEALKRLDDPDAVFIGGSGGRMADIVDYSSSRLRKAGRIVINTITIENTSEAVNALRRQRFKFEVVMVNVARSKDLLGMIGFEALNPIQIITGWKD